MTEEAFLRYRMAVVERMPDSPSKRTLTVAIRVRMEVLARSPVRPLDGDSRVPASRHPRVSPPALC
jgi:hypothetical protein